MTQSGAPLVLVVEDILETRLLYAGALTACGFRVEQAHNGHQALEKAFATKPDLILTDIALPGLDGIELCQRLRADTRTVDIPVLAVTGHSDRQYSDRILQVGANYVLIKPCGLERIVSEACRLLAERRALAHLHVSR